MTPLDVAAVDRRTWFLSASPCPYFETNLIFYRVIAIDIFFWYAHVKSPTSCCDYDDSDIKWIIYFYLIIFLV